VVGAKGWAVLTADGRIRYRGLETEALMRAEVRCFVLAGIGAGHPQLAVNFLQALPRIEALLAEHPGPFIAKVYRGGEVKIWLDLAAWQASRGIEEA
jgi:hypothetical protein